MATTAPPTATRPAAPVMGKEDTPLLARIEKHRRVLTWAVGALVLIGFGGWLFSETNRRKEVEATNAIDAARGSFESGNLPGASAEFQRIIQVYGGTDAANQAQLGLNTVRLASGQTQLAVDELRKFANSGVAPFYAAGAWSMLGGALENLGKYDDAAAAYIKGSEAAPEDYRKVDGLLGAARSYRLGGKQKEGLDVLRGIISKFGDDVPGTAEAKVRLAELTRGAM